MDFMTSASGMLGSGLTQGLAFLLVLSVVVFIHELGHFLVARWCGVEIAAFSMGFGQEVAGFNDRHGTRWKLSWIPLGGYVKFKDDENPASLPTGANKIGADDFEGAFRTKPLWQRAAVVAAGPAANLLLALVVFSFTFAVFGVNSPDPIVDEVVADSAAEKAGVKAADRIVEIDGRAIQTFSDVQRIVGPSAGRQLKVVIERAGTRIPLQIKPDSREVTDSLGNKLEVGVIGIKRASGAAGAQVKRYSLPAAISLAASETGSVAYQIVAGLPRIPSAIGKVFMGQRQSEIGGPFAIAEMSAQATKSGVAATLQWIALFSIMLGIMNLLPIPLLDGGHLMFYALEAIRGRPLDEAKQELSFKIGMAIVATIMVAALMSDVMRKIGIG